MRQRWQISSVVVVDPDMDLVGSETFSRIRIREKSFRIRNEFEVKLLWKTDKFDCFLNMQPNTLTRREYKGKIYVKNIIKSSCRILNQLKSRIRIRKNHSGSTTTQIRPRGLSITRYRIYQFLNPTKEVLNQTMTLQVWLPEQPGRSRNPLLAPQFFPSAPWSDITIIHYFPSCS